MWSSDASNNLIVSQSSGEVAATAICATPDGGFYISWLDSAKGYSLYLQRLDVDGNALWESNGKLVYARNIQSFIEYGLSIDPDGNAIVGIDSGIAALQAPGGSALAFKISPAGELVWGAAGIALSPPDENVSVMLCCGTSDRGAAFSWGKVDQEDLIRITKLDSAGNQLWSANAASDIPAAKLTPTNLVAADGGSVIYAFVHAVNKLSGTYDSVLAQKLAATDGAGLWGGTPVTVVDSSEATAVTLPRGEVPTVIADAAGGAIFGYPLVDTTQRIHVQRVTPTGEPCYVANGVLVSGNRVDGSAARFGFEPHGERVYIAWTANLAGISSVRAQSIDNTGALQWDEAGIALTAEEPVATMSPVAVLPVMGGVIAAWIQQPPQGAFLPQPVRVCLLDPSGAPLWQNPVEDLKTSATDTTGYAVGTVGATGYGAFAWASGDCTIRAQNINLDGTLGVAT
jgi:hypothetical protein